MRSICDTCAIACVCPDRSFSMAKCDRYRDHCKVLKKAVSTYGAETQKWVLVGEIGELLDAIADHKRGRCTVDHIAEEIADVLICLQQLQYIYECQNAVMLWHEKKIIRLAQKLATGEENTCQ